MIMKKTVSVAFATIASIILILVVVFTALQYTINDETFITNEFTALELSDKMGISNTELVLSMTRLVDYMDGDADDISVTVNIGGAPTEMFALEQEVSHMADVRLLYQTIRGYRDIGALVMLVLFLFAALVDFKFAPQRLAQGYLSGAFVAFLFFGFLGTWAMLDFSSFWTAFHMALFWNDEWLFDAAESRMINMMPEQLFSDIIGQMALYAGILIGLLILLSVLALFFSSARYKRGHAQRLAARRRREAARAERKKALAARKAEKEKAKRLAEKKKRKAEAMKRRAEAEEARRKAEEKARRKAERGRGKSARAADDGYDRAPLDIEGGAYANSTDELTARTTAHRPSPPIFMMKRLPSSPFMPMATPMLRNPTIPTIP